MRISQIERVVADGGRVALWGWGAEGRAAYHALRSRLLELPLTLLCTPQEIVAAHALDDPWLVIDTDASGERLSTFQLVVKSPGISPCRPEVVAAVARGTRFIGGTTIWFAEHADADADGIVSGSLCVTGTKGKSTTTALLAHLLRAGGHRTALAGNIGLPLLQLLDPPLAPAFWAIELSSYQTRDVAASGVRPEIAIVLNVFPEHLDWHGGEARYVEDKLALLTAAGPRVAVLNAEDERLVALSLPDSEVRWFGRADGWHLRGDALYRGDGFVMDTGSLPLPGRHNRGNLCAALTAIEALGLDAAALAPHAITFSPLPHRLQTLGTRDGITWVNDSISTTPHASLAALDLFRGQRIAILVGGHDRGLDWIAFAKRLRDDPPAVVVTMGANGPRIHALLEPIARGGGFALDQADNLTAAVELARAALGEDGVLLLSPGAPSFGAYRDYVERGRHFAALGGFDPDAISSIAGLGIAP